MVVRGDPGIGKTALLDHAVLSASGFQVARATGVESEMELPFAGLHQLCAPLLDRLALLPGPQRDAMSAAFGLAEGRRPDRFLIGLAVLTLLTEAAEKTPLLCVVDDTNWLDQASAHALAFAGRRLLADRVCLLFGTRHRTEELNGFPELVLGGLPDGDARTLVASILRGPLDDRVLQRVIAETGGNPLALLEWSRGLTEQQRAGTFGPMVPFAGEVEETFRRRVMELPASTQVFLTVAAAEPTGDPVLVWRAASRLGIEPPHAAPAIDAGLIELGARVRFCHPVVRSAAYGTASPDARRDAHRALAAAIDAAEDPDRRAWHLALATPAPDEDVADELERSAGRTLARGGLTAAAALLERSVALSADPAKRARRTLAAGGAYVEAGTPEAAYALLAPAEAGRLDEASRAQIEILRGNATTGWGNVVEGTRLQLSAAKRLGAIDARAARDTYMNALGSAVSSCDPAIVEETSRMAEAAPHPPGPKRPQDILLDGLSTFLIRGPAAASPILRRALGAFRGERIPWEEAWWFGHEMAAAVLLWDYEKFVGLAEDWVLAARDIGALRMLPVALDALAISCVFGGAVATAASLVGETESIIETTRGSYPIRASALLAALRGHEAEAQAAIGRTIDRARAQQYGSHVKTAQCARATLYIGLGRYEEAVIAAQEASQPPPNWASHLTLHDLVEAASRTGRRAVAAQALDELSESAEASGTDWALGIDARCRALLSAGDTAEAAYLDAIEKLGRSPIRPEAARAHLLYGEWLRRERRRAEARKELHVAHEMFETIGMHAFAERTRRELHATGESVRKRSVPTLTELSAQEAQVAKLARDGLSNPEIGARLFISARTVQYHLSKVFTKLGITSRSQLDRVLE
jgi:DNA-binding CsgD family transcriptional regulator